MQTSLHVIAKAARNDKKKRFKSLYSLLNRHLLTEAYHALNKAASSGVDDVSYEEYGKNLEQNIINLETKLKNKRYFAQVVKRVEIPKDNKGKTRPLGILVMDDKIAQKVVSDLLVALYDPLFSESSYAYREGRSARQAVEDLQKQLVKHRVVVEIDIAKFFDSINHEMLIKMLEVRINDRAVIGLIRKWLKAGIRYDDGHVENPEFGTPQGAIISPILANIYLHYVFDEWFELVIKRQCKNGAIQIRYADDITTAFQSDYEAARFLKQVEKRLKGFGLNLSKEKTRKVIFNRYDVRNRESFNFLGFEFKWDKCAKGFDTVHTRTSHKKLSKTIAEFSDWIRKHRSMPFKKLIEVVKSKIRGHVNYFNIYGNSKRIGQYYYAVESLLYKWLNRRSQRKSFTWESLRRMLEFHNVKNCARLKNQGYQLSFLSLLF